MHSTKLYVIGNGFNLWHGIPSIYTQFRDYLRQRDRNHQIDALKPADIQRLRVDMIAIRAVSTVNHYLAMGYNDYSMLVQVYVHWIDSESPSELECIWAGMQNMRKLSQICPKNLAKKL